MRTTLALDDELIAKAQALTGLQEKAALVREALKALIERESARRLARLGGSDPGDGTATATGMILIDISVWVDHLRACDSALIELLERGAVLGHPFVTGELALGNLRQQ
jgi:hypothetical protein